VLSFAFTLTLSSRRAFMNLSNLFTPIKSILDRCRQGSLVMLGSKFGYNQRCTRTTSNILLVEVVGIAPTSRNPPTRVINSSILFIIPQKLLQGNTFCYWKKLGSLSNADNTNFCFCLFCECHTTIIWIDPDSD